MAFLVFGACDSVPLAARRIVKLSERPLNLSRPKVAAAAAALPPDTRRGSITYTFLKLGLIIRRRLRLKS